VAGCCECGDEPSGSCATELVNLVFNIRLVISTRRSKNTRDYICKNIYIYNLQFGLRKVGSEFNLRTPLLLHCFHIHSQLTLTNL
jgi:hypothetical protein